MKNFISEMYSYSIERFKIYREPILVFLFAIVLGKLVWSFIELPFSNPFGIVGPLPKKMFNPNTNIIRFLVVVSLPSLLLLLFNYYSSHFRSKEFNIRTPQAYSGRLWNTRAILFIITCWVLTSVAMHFYYGLKGERGTPRVSAVAEQILRLHSTDISPSPLDIFHEGEYLSPGFLYEKTKRLNTGSYIIHGIVYDILTAPFGWWIMGSQTIGSYRVGFALNYALLPLALFFLILQIARSLYSNYKNQIVFIVLSILFIEVGYGGFFSIDRRDVVFFLGLGFLVTGLVKNKKIYIFLAAMMVPLNFVFTIDRGAYLFLVSFLGLGYGMFFSPERYTKKVLQFFLYVFGLFTGVSILYFSLGVVEWASWIENTTSIVKTKDYFDSFVYPFSSVGLLHLKSNRIILLSLGLFIFCFNFLKIFRHKKFFAQGMVFFILLMTSLACYRTALGRSDAVHISYSVFPLYLLIVSGAIHWLLAEISPKRLEKIFLCSLGVVVILTFVNVKVLRFQRISQIAKNLKKYSQMEDSKFLNEELGLGIINLKNLLADEPCVLNLTSDAALSYLLKKESCSRHYYGFLSSPNYLQEEILSDIKEKGPQFLIYDSTYPMSAIDGISNLERLYNVVEYINNNYQFHAFVAPYWSVYKLK